MTTTPLSRSHNINWIDSHNKICKNISTSHYSTLLIGDSIIAGLSRYPEVWKRYLEPLNALNCGIGGDRVQNVLWRCVNLPSSLSVSNIVILCGTSNIMCDSPDEIADGITHALKRIYHPAKIVFWHAMALHFCFISLTRLHSGIQRDSGPNFSLAGLPTDWNCGKLCHDSSRDLGRPRTAYS